MSGSILPVRAAGSIPGSSTEKGRRDAALRPREGAYTDTWARRNGEWLAIAANVSAQDT